MDLSCDDYATDIISLKRPTALDKVADTIEKPTGAIPTFGLPKWKVMPLDSKIPLIPGPPDSYNFTRRKLGKNLWISSSHAEFNLSDPNCYEIKFDYDPLHDKHLVQFFSRPRNLQNLIKLGIVSSSRDAKCSLKDYNMYRKYLRKLHCDRIKEEIHQKSNLAVEKRAIEYAEEQAQKEMNRLKNRERLSQGKRAAFERKRQAEIKAQAKKQQEIQQRLIELAKEKREQQQKLLGERKAREKMIQEKKKTANEITRRKIIKTVVGWRKKELIRKKAREQRLAQELEQKSERIKQKWEMRVEYQKQQIETQRFLMNCIDRKRQEFIDNYKKKLNKEDKRMQRLLENAKTFLKCYFARRRPGNLRRVCCEKYLTGDQDKERDKIKALICRSNSYSSPVIDDDTKIKARIKTKGKQALIQKKISKSIKSSDKKRIKKRKKDGNILEKDMHVVSESKIRESETNEKADSKCKIIEMPLKQPIAMVKDKCKCEILKQSHKRNN